MDDAAKPDVTTVTAARKRIARAMTKTAKPLAVAPATALPATAQPAVKPVAEMPAVAAQMRAATPQPAAPAGTATATGDVTMDTINTTTDKAQAMFAVANDRTKGVMEKGQKMVDEMTSFSKGNIEAIVESSKIAAKGLESFGQDAAAYARKSFEEATAAAKTLASVKSPTEFMKLQSDYVRGAFDMMIAEASRSTETMLKLAGEVAQPISNRVALAAEKVKIAA